MALDLTRALVVTLAVTLFPGFFWCRALVPVLDRTERLTFALGLSLTLVPATAWVLARLLGSGVTLSVSILSVATASLLGYIALRRLGEPQSVDLTVPLRSPHLGTPALLALCAAGSLALLISLGVLDVNETWWLVALAMVAVAVLGRARPSSDRLGDPSGRYLEGAYSESSPPPGSATATRASAAGNGGTVATRLRPSPVGEQTVHPLVRSLALPAVLALTLVRGYVGPVLREWPFIRGQDQYAHAAMTNLMMERGATESFLIYPPGFHALSAVLARLSGLEPIDLYPFVAPALLLLPALACYVLASRLFGWASGVAAACLAGVLLRGSYLFVLDGTYVDLLAAQFLLVLCVGALALVLHAPTARSAALLALLGSSVVLYHAVATIQLALILGLVALVVLPTLLLRDRRTGVVLFLSLAMLSVLSLGYAWETYDVPRTAARVLGVGGTTTGTLDHASRAVGTQKPRGPKLYLHHISQPVGWFGLLGVLLLAGGARRLGRFGSLVMIVFLGWCLLFFAASRTSLSAFPIRFTRDLGAPLAIAGGYALVAVGRSLRGRRRALVAACAATAGLSLAVGAAGSLATAADGVQVHLLTPEIRAAGAWLREHNEGGNIVVSPHLNQAPGNAMMAMGGYAGLPSHSPAQFAQPRQIPARDLPEVREALWVLRHPNSARTRSEILPRRDVRYVVLYKRLRKGSYWFGTNPINPRPFELARGTYRRAYENDFVVIFRVVPRA